MSNVLELCGFLCPPHHLAHIQLHLWSSRHTKPSCIPLHTSCSFLILTTHLFSAIPSPSPFSYSHSFYRMLSGSGIERLYPEGCRILAELCPPSHLTTFLSLPKKFFLCQEYMQIHHFF